MLTTKSSHNRRKPGKAAGLARLYLCFCLPLFILCISCADSDQNGDEKTKIRFQDPLILTSSSETLSLERLAENDEETIRDISSLTVSEALYSEKTPEDAIAAFFPSSGELLAMLARDRDVDDFIENSNEDGAAGEYYRNVVRVVSEMKPLRSRYEALFSGAYSGLLQLGRMKVALQASKDALEYRSGVTLPRLSSKPRVREYSLSHTFALDIFFQKIEYLPLSTLEKGPLVFSLEPGIVVASDTSWNGGEDMNSYRGGGVTPKAGNGVIIYSPKSRKYYLYFHLYDLRVNNGEVIPKGYPLGHGGNTGTNARKPGHGEHLHLEIYDAASNRFLRNSEIADIVF